MEERVGSRCGDEVCGGNADSRGMTSGPSQAVNFNLRGK